MINHEQLQRICRYMGTLDLASDRADASLKKVIEALDSHPATRDPQAQLRAALTFLRSRVVPTFSVRDHARPITRSRMTYREFSDQTPATEYPWQRQARKRRAILLALLVLALSFGVVASTQIFSGSGILGLAVPIILIFSLLFTWVAFNCITTLFGFLVFWKGHDPLDPAHVLGDQTAQVADDTTIAVLLPIYNEDVTQILAGLHVMVESLATTAHAKHFTFFILSDTQDPDIWVDEEVAWRNFCVAHHTQGRVIYRHRKSRVGRKSGNVADFCRRWGSQFRYMIVLDSDSLLDGHTMVQMARIMDARPDIGILQTTPQLFNAKTLLARLQQFASQAYGTLFTIGLHFWQLGDASYWGHNAIIRLEPFMKYCALPKSVGRLPLGGMILSHDSIEAALMRRAGWGVWLAYSLTGSFEQPPATLTTELARDARWCRGNIQHLRFVGLEGLTLGHRWLFINGNFFYGASFLWMLLLIFITANSIAKSVLTPNYFPHAMSLFPEWPNEHHEISFVLLAVTFIYLFLPKGLALIATALSPKSRQGFGGRLQLLISSLAELLCSSLLAPLRMVLHSYHVLTALTGRRFDWHVSSRSTLGISLWDALKIGTVPMLMGLIIAYYLYAFDRTLFWWTTAVSLPLIFSIPLAIVISQGDAGQWLRRWGLLRVPTEASPSPEIRRYNMLLAEEFTPTLDPLAQKGFAGAILNPHVQALHLQILRQDRNLHPAVQSRRKALADEALKSGPHGLSPRHKKEILCDPQLLAALHDAVWTLPEKEFMAWTG